MENNTDKLIQDQFNSLPADVKEAIARVPWKQRVADIAKRENLTPEQEKSLETEAMLVLYGFVSPDTFTNNIVTEVRLGEEQADRISKLVNDEIVVDIEKQLEMIDALAPKDSIGTPVTQKGDVPIEEKKDYLNISPEILAKQVKMPEATPDVLPETLPGQIAHDVPHLEVATTKAPEIPPAPRVVPAPSSAPTPAPTITPMPESVPPTAPTSIVEEKLSQVVSAPAQPSAVSYAPGKDPYREPIE